jgi:photosystem II stability/assembly factor-like uncharacterized protein
MRRLSFDERERVAVVGTLGLLAVLAPAAVSGDTSLEWGILRQGDFHTNFSDVEWSPSGGRLVAVGDDGVVVLSTDGGASWQTRPSGTTADLLSVGWQDESRLWAAGKVNLGWTTEGVLLRSVDGGTTWTTVIGHHPTTLAGVFFYDADHGWVGGTAAELLRTTDGGDTWIPVDTLGAPTYNLDFTSTSLGHSAGTGMSFDLYRSTDAGSSWSIAYESPRGTIVGLSFPTSLDGFIADVRGVVTTADGGETWSLASELSEVWLADIAFATAADGWVVGSVDTLTNEDSLILKSTDGGASWAPQVLRTPNALAAVAVRDTSTACAAGQYGTLAMTADGVTWDLAGRELANDIRDLVMVDAAHGWAVGPPASVLRTANGGAAWTPVTDVGDDDLRAIQPIDDDNLVACGSYTFIASVDGGDTWQERFTFMDCWALHFFDELNGLAGTYHGVFRTADGGFNWLYDGAGAGSGGIFDFHFLTPSHGFAAAGIEHIYETLDGGITWTLVHDSPPPNVYLRSITFADPDHGWAVGDEGLILMTDDGGANWTEQTSGVGVNLFDVHFWDPLHGFAVGQAGTIIATDDGGATWLQVASSTDATMYSISALSPDLRWIGGAWGTVLGPPSSLFADGFESGTPSAWSSVVP